MSSTTDRIKGAASDSADQANKSNETAKKPVDETSQDASRRGPPIDYVQAAKEAIDRATNYAHRKL